MKKINFLFGIHNHQPVGNFEHVFEECFQNSYLPFIEILERHPGIKISLHTSFLKSQSKAEWCVSLQVSIRKNRDRYRASQYYPSISISILNPIHPLRSQTHSIPIVSIYIEDQLSLELILLKSTMQHSSPEVKIGRAHV